ncbi:MAG TPA: NUDIX hydrolase [Candidatus Saccharimonadales bacterium]|nr:NUDIX hydrolase [Candidatus Saccharimonadales bacterium]
MTSQPLLTGQWDDNQSWQLYRSDELPDIALCTAVYCLAILPAAEQVVLARNHRGWEMLGGHIEPGETVERALLRECLEEGGFTPEHYRLFGYRKITAKRPVSHNQRVGGFYPFPHGFIPHFIATSDLPLQRPSGLEIVESRVFSFDEVAKLHIEQWPILRAMLDSYRKTANFTQSPSAKISP